MQLDIDTAHDLARPFFVFNLLTPRKNFSADVTFLANQELLATEVAISDMRLDRTPSRMSSFDTETIIVEQYYAGITRGVLEDTRTEVMNGVVHIMDWSRPYKAVMKSAVGIALHIPHERIDYDPSRHLSYRALSTQSAMGRLLSTGLDRLITELKLDASFETDELITAVLGLVKTCLTADASWLRDPEYDQGRRRLVEGYIRRNLQEPGLNADRVCRDLGMSRATLYRCFDGKGVDRTIQDARLDHCFSALLHLAPRRGAVRDVSERWGFHDASRFLKAFRRKFGFAPSECIWKGDTQETDRPARPHPVLKAMRKK